jgi:hypothetical protein
VDRSICQPPAGACKEQKTEQPARDKTADRGCLFPSTAHISGTSANQAGTKIQNREMQELEMRRQDGEENIFPSGINLFNARPAFKNILTVIFLDYPDRVTMHLYDRPK